MADAKYLRQKYGITMKPIPCTSAYKRVMPFDHKTHVTMSWILVNNMAKSTPDGKPCEGTRTHVNTYNGETKAGFNADKATFALGDEKTFKKKLAGYVACQISECPVAVDATSVTSDAG